MINKEQLSKPLSFWCISMLCWFVVFGTHNTFGLLCNNNSSLIHYCVCVGMWFRGVGHANWSLLKALQLSNSSHGNHHLKELFLREKRERERELASCRCRQNGPLKTGVIEKLAKYSSSSKSSRKRKPPSMHERNGRKKKWKREIMGSFFLLYDVLLSPISILRDFL